MIRRPPRSTQSRSSAASDVYKRQSLAQLRQALFAAHPHFMRIDQIAAGDAADIQKLAKLAGSTDKAPLRSSVPEFYLTNAIARASATMAECSALANACLLYT